MKLTDRYIKALKPEIKTKRHFDGNGMYLEVSPAGGKWWRLKYRINGSEKRISLGTYPEVSLQAARTAANEYREMIREGLDPSVERRRSKSKNAITFFDVGQEWLEKEKPNWRASSRIGGRSLSSMP